RSEYLLLSFFFFVALISAAVVTLDSIQIFTTHVWLLSKPTVYFQCRGENSTVLPDVKEKDVLYAFKGEESWQQPVTVIQGIKCKRCGFYEEDNILPDEVFDEWEFCASDFVTPDGKYIHFKANEINATFLCPECFSLWKASNPAEPTSGSSKIRSVLIAAACILASCVFFIVSMAAFKCWERRKRQQEQARFLKLFEEVDDAEDELGIGPLSHTV
ncbi:hypothetical protein M569_07706, partial [Genlisea aurea]